MTNSDAGRDASAASEAPFAMTDLEERLAQAGGETLRARLDARFAEIRGRVAADMAAGLPPDAFRAAQAAPNALDAARRMIAAPRPR